MAYFAVVLTVILVLVNKPWESQQNKDCITEGMNEFPNAMNGTGSGPDKANAKREIEAFCHQQFG